MEVIPWALMEEPESNLQQKGWQTPPPQDPQINQVHPVTPPKPTQLIKLADCRLLKGSE